MMNKELENNTTLSHYRILQKIGAGGMGEVYLAEDTRLDRKVAVKFLNQEFSRDADKLNRFIQEAKAASALNHPNILTVHEIGESGDSKYIVTEFIEGKTLREQLFSDESISLSAILKIGVQVAEALAAAHQVGIIHRDIKPENVMIRADGYAKVLDFGLAKLTEKKKSEQISSEGETKVFVQTNPGVVMGTVSYMSPEQARGKETDARTDLWSLGVVLYEMLSGKVPFAGETINHTIVSILEKEPLLLENIPDELQRIVRKALTKDKEMRYQTARDLLIDLKNLRRTLDIQGELERSVIPNREAAKSLIHENATIGYSEKSVEETQGESEAKATQNITNASSLEYAVTQAKSHKLATAVIGIILLGAILALAYFALFARGNTKQIESIAVMPFTNGSGNPDVEYLSDGMTETLISSLSQLPNLNVKARSSVFRYKGKETNPQTVGRELNVQAVLNGRVVQRGDRLILTLELVDVRTENVIWSEPYNRKQSDLIALQSEIARDVSGKLKLKLSGADEQKLNKVYTTDPEAYQLYLKGRFYWLKLTPEDMSRSLEFYQQAIDKDPAFALAYAGISDVYMVLGIPDVMMGTIPPQESVRQARNAADKALEIDPTLAEAYASRAHVKWKERDWAGADEDFKRSIELNGNYPNARRFYSIYLAGAGRSEEAIREVRRAEELEPLSVSVKAHVAYIFYLARRYDEAVEAGKKALELDASSPVAHQRLGSAYEEIGMFPEAIAEFQKAVDGSNRVQLAVGSLAHGFALAGKRAEAERLLAELRERSATEYVSSYLIAEVYAALGEKEAAFKYLDKAYDERSIDLVLAKVDPRLDPLRDEPRFQELLKKVGFP